MATSLARGYIPLLGKNRKNSHSDPSPSSREDTLVEEANRPKDFITEDVLRESGQMLHFLAEDRPAQHQLRSHWRMWDWFLGTHFGQIALLALVAFFLIFSGTVLWILLGGNEAYDTSFEQSLWFSWGMFFDPGTEMGMNATDYNSHKWAAVFFSMMGFLFNLVFLSTIVDYTKYQLEVWKKTRSRIVANGHTVLLGWTETTLFLLKELAASMENRGQKSLIVVLADKDEVDMGKDVHLHFPTWADFRGQKIVCRRGDPTVMEDLDKVSARSAQEVIVLGPGGNPEHADNAVIQSVMALACLPEEPSGNIIAECKMFETAAVIDAVMERAEGLIAPEAITRLLCLQSTNPMIADIFKSFLTFEMGDELYCLGLDELKLSPASCSNFGIACRAVAPKNMICIGIKPANALPLLVPSDHHPIVKEDKLIVIAGNIAAEDAMSETAELEPGSNLRRSRSKVTMPQMQPTGDVQTVIIVGWPAGLPRILETLVNYLTEKIELHILADMTEDEQRRRLKESHIPIAFREQGITHHRGSTRKIEVLSQLPLAKASIILVLADRDEPTAKASDSACLASMLTIHKLLQGKHPEYAHCAGSSHIVCEVKSAATHRVFNQQSNLKAQLTTVTFFKRTALEAGMLAVASADRTCFNVLLMLLHPSQDLGDIDMVPLDKYLKDDEIREIDYWDLWTRVRQKNEILIGWKFLAADTPTLNPAISSEPLSFSSPRDSLIVIRRNRILNTPREPA